MGKVVCVCWSQDDRVGDPIVIAGRQDKGGPFVSIRSRRSRLSASFLEVSDRAGFLVLAWSVANRMSKELLPATHSQKTGTSVHSDRLTSSCGMNG